MMYLNLMKVFFRENLSFKRILGTDLKTSKTKAILIIVAIVYGFGTILLGFGYMFFDFGNFLQEADMLATLLNFVFIYATMLSMFFILFRANGYLFHYKDFDLLQPLPIKGRTVILAKLTVMLSFVYITIFLIVSPILFSYFYHGGFNVIKLLMTIVLLLVVPLIPLVIFSFVSLLIWNISSRLPFGKAINIILMFVFFLGIMYFSMTMNMSSSNPLLGQMNFLDNLSKYLITAKWFTLAIDEMNVLAFLGMIFISIAALVIFVLAIEKFVLSTNQRRLTTRYRVNKKATVSKSRNVLMNIISKETKKFFNVTIYVFNNGFGVIMMAILGVAVIIFKDKLVVYLDAFSQIDIAVEAIILLLLGFLISTVFTSAISLSLEGKNFWIIKSLPIKAETVMFGKMLFNVILTLPIALFAIFMSGIALEISFVNVLVMMVYIVTLCFLSSGMGSIVNLHFPKFNYVSETEVVKQSLGALLGMFSAWIIVMINGVIYYFLSDSLDFTFLILINILVNAVLFSGVFFYIKNRSQIIFNKL